MKKKIKINKKLCIGCGTCVALEPEVFALDNNGKAYVKKNVDVESADLEMVKDSCPVEAIELEK